MFHSPPSGRRQPVGRTTSTILSAALIASLAVAPRVEDWSTVYQD